MCKIESGLLSGQIQSISEDNVCEVACAQGYRPATFLLTCAKGSGGNANTTFKRVGAPPPCDGTGVRLFKAGSSNDKACFPLYEADLSQANHATGAPFFHKLAAPPPVHADNAKYGGAPNQNYYLTHKFAKAMTLESGTTISVTVRSLKTTWSAWGGIFAIMEGNTELTGCVGVSLCCLAGGRRAACGAPTAACARSTATNPRPPPPRPLSVAGTRRYTLKGGAQLMYLRGLNTAKSVECVASRAAAVAALEWPLSACGAPPQMLTWERLSRCCCCTVCAMPLVSDTLRPRLERLRRP